MVQSGQQRDSIMQLAPPWLSTGNAEKLLYDFGLCADSLVEKMNQATRAHMPGQGTNTALVFIGSDRMIPRGPFESDGAYAGRLSKAFEEWQRAGSRRAVLSQVAAYLSLTQSTVAGPMTAIVGGAGPTWDLYYANSDISLPPVHVVAPGDFNWDNQMSRWWRAWLIVYVAPQPTGRTGSAATFTSASGFATVGGLSGMTTADVGNVLVISGAASGAHNGPFRIESFVSSSTVTVSCGVSLGGDANNGAIHWDVRTFNSLAPGPAWGAPGAKWGDMSRSWGLANPPGVMAGVIAILRQWQSEHSFYPETMICFSADAGISGTDLSPYSTPGTGNPDGTWGHFSKIAGSTSVPARVFTDTSPTEAFAKFNCFCGGSDS